MSRDKAQKRQRDIWLENETYTLLELLENVTKLANYKLSLYKGFYKPYIKLYIAYITIYININISI